MLESEPLPLLEVNRPFLLATRDDETGALLFLGAVTDPVSPWSSTRKAPQIQRRHRARGSGPDRRTAKEVR
ncbi:MAG: serpin family protein [Symbiobacterium sp.]|uniref:serpin family protein n=1 Tax=Symbiobacterium sp. TaxID=1971213 RepID=UPI0034641848